jgi:hypothetical protein
MDILTSLYFVFLDNELYLRGLALVHCSLLAQGLEFVPYEEE